MSCLESYAISLPACPETIDVISDAFEAVTDYVIDISDSLGNHYRDTITTNSYGQLIIDTSFLPSGLLIPEHGDFLLCIYDSSGQKVDLTFEAKQYASVYISFYNYQGDASAVIE